MLVTLLTLSLTVTELNYFWAVGEAKAEGQLPRYNLAT